MKRILLSTALIATVSTTVFAGGTGDMGPRPQAPVYHPAAPVEVPTHVAASCEGPTLKEGQWTITAGAGIAPRLDSRKARISQRFVDGTTGGQIFTRTHNADHNNVPFTANFALGYVPMDNVEAFFNFEFTTNSGRGRRLTAASIDDPAGVITLHTRYKQDDYTSYGFYLGGRYFFDLDCKVSPFLGAKLGLVSRSNGKHRVRNIATQNGSVIMDADYRIRHTKDSTGFSGGIQGGLDYCVSDPFSLFLMAEVIGTTGSNGHKHERRVFTNTRNDVLYARATRSQGGNFTFPITAGIKVRM